MNDLERNSIEDNHSVSVWEEEITIPTYPVGEPDKNPMFFEKRVYQGSSGVVYPHSIIEKIYDEKVDKSYTGLFVENQYIKILILPELGGRIHMAYDKLNERHFVYHNQVIKPALVGLLGPWISGGIEFNWPQHHRPSTFQPIDYTLQEHEDGSKSIWTNEVELMFHTKGLAGFRLYPDRAYLEINVQLYNRTKLPQTFLWWANPAVSVDEHYQSVFPPDVNAVFDHGKRDVATFPIAKGTYYKVDYSPGTDISRYKNIPVPTSYMAIQSDYDFVGGYEHDTKSGILHVANHHISPGKKQWTWGNGDFGKAWDRNLTDDDGPYIELMTGVYTDNQPDFSWLMPGEEKSFSQYFIPYREVGITKNATKDLIINIEPVDSRQAKIKVFATSNQPNCHIKLFVQNELAFTDHADLSPESVYATIAELNKKITENNYVLLVENQHGEECIRYEPATNRRENIPEPAKHTKAPSEMESTEQLYLTGLHLEQYRHATYSPVPYYKEALRRDPDEVRNNNALGKWYLRRGRFKKSESYFRKSIETLTERNPNPYHGEPYYNLGVSLKYQGKLLEAYAEFYKATWNKAWQDSGYFSLAEISVWQEDFEEAHKQINKSLDYNSNNSKVWALKASILRKRKQLRKAIEVTNEAISRDVFNLSACFEQYLVYSVLGDSDNAESALNQLLDLSRENDQNLISYALDYASSGQFEEAAFFLSFILKTDEQGIHPMVFYYLGWFYSQQQMTQKALKFYQKGADANPAYCFPNRLEAIPVLLEAQNINQADAWASYYLGCLYYDKRQYDLAIEQWELSAKRNSQFPTVHRNLGIAYFNKREQHERAVKKFEKAYSLNTSDARVLMELDQLYKRTNKKPQKRLQFLEDHINLIKQRDDLYLERAALYNFLNQHEKAYKLIMNRKFHPWEGGEGKVSGQYVYGLTEMAKNNIKNKNYAQAIEQLNQAQTYPPNLGEGKLYGTRENDWYYWLGIAHQQIGNNSKAEENWQKAIKGDSNPTAAIFYNDQPPEKILYQGLAYQKLGRPDKAQAIFKRLVEYGKTHQNDKVKIDYFAVSLPDLLIFDDDLSLRNQIHCQFMTVLGQLGLGNLAQTKSLCKNILGLKPMHFGAKTHLQLARWFDKQPLYQERNP